jgi:photosystem II stability/assembly factor-like uncharacterized protein
LRTTDKGLTWSSQSSGTKSWLNAVAAADANTAWAVGFDGTIVGTRNGGETWALQTSGTAETLFGVVFSDTDTGWAVGDSGTIRHTIDGGNAWNAQVSGTNRPLYSVGFANAQIGWVVGNGATVLHTFTGGEKLEVPVFAGTPGTPNCHGESVSALVHEFGGLKAAASALRFPSVQAVQDAIRAFCRG